MRRPRGQGLLGGAIGITTLLLLAACGGSSDEAAPTPEPTVAIAEAPTATAAPAEPTATPEPTAAPTATPEPIAAPELTVEEQVIAAWERYLDLSIQARGKEPTGEAADLGTFIADEARARLQAVIDEQVTNDQYVIGTATSLNPALTIEGEASVVVADCVSVDLARVRFSTDETLTTQVDVRFSRARFELLEGEWLVTGIESGDGAAECDA